MSATATNLQEQYDALQERHTRLRALRTDVYTLTYALKDFDLHQRRGTGHAILGASLSDGVQALDRPATERLLKQRIAALDREEAGR